MTAKPVLVMIAGPNGSGKTTLTKQLVAEGVDLGTYINPDDIADGLSGAYRDRVAQAQQIADQRRQECIERGENFSFETVMSHESKIAVLQQARERGFTVILYFVGTESPELNVARVRQRVDLAGHDVPEDRIVARYARSMRFLSLAIRQCDRAVIFDNSFKLEGDRDVVMRPVVEVRILRKASAPETLEFQWGGFERGALPDWVKKALSIGWPLFRD